MTFYDDRYKRGKRLWYKQNSKMSHDISSHCPTLEVTKEIGVEATVALALVASMLALSVVAEVVK